MSQEKPTPTDPRVGSGSKNSEAEGNSRDAQKPDNPTAEQNKKAGE